MKLRYQKFRICSDLMSSNLDRFNGRKAAYKTSMIVGEVFFFFFVQGTSVFILLEGMVVGVVKIKGRVNGTVRETKDFDSNVEITVFILK